MGRNQERGRSGGHKQLREPIGSSVRGSHRSLSVVLDNVDRGVGVGLRGTRWIAQAGHTPIHPPRPPGHERIARPNTAVPISPGPVVQGNQLILDVPLKDLPGLASGAFWWSTRTSVDAEFADELPDTGHQEGDTFVARFGG